MLHRLAYPAALLAATACSAQPQEAAPAVAAGAPFAVRPVADLDAPCRWRSCPTDGCW